MKKIFAIMTISILFAMACSADKEEKPVIQGISGELNEGLKETNDKLGDVSDMDKYGTELKEGSFETFVHAASVLYLDSQITKLKMATTMVINGTLPSNRTLDGEIFQRFFASPIDRSSASAGSVIFDNEVVLQMATQGSLTKINDPIVKTSGGEDVDIEEYTLYTYDILIAEIKISKNLDIFTGPDSITGDWQAVVGAALYYLIKKAGSEVIAIPVIKNDDNSFLFVGDINSPEKLNTYTKE